MPWRGDNKGGSVRVRNSLGSSGQGAWGMTATDSLRAAQEEDEKGKEHNTHTSYEQKSSAHTTDDLSCECSPELELC